MPTSRDLIDAINAGKSAVIQSTFEAVMSEKIDNAIETYRQAVIENMFESEELDEEDLVEDADNQSIDLSEYTLEEIQEFMESEDFAALDELSKKTLGSYIKKSSLGNLAQKDKEHAHTKDMLAHMSNGATKDALASAKTVASISKGIVKRQTGINKATDKLAKD